MLQQYSPAIRSSPFQVVIHGLIAGVQFLCSIPVYLWHGLIYPFHSRSGTPLQLVLLDHGLYDSLPDEKRVALCCMYQAILDSNESEMKKASSRLGVEGNVHLFVLPFFHLVCFVVEIRKYLLSFPSFIDELTVYIIF